MAVDKEFLDLVENGKMRSGQHWGCGMILFDPNSEKILLARRKDTKTWATPGGKIEPGETPKQGVLRETKEESNVTVNSMICYDYCAHLAENNGKNWLDFLFISSDFDYSNLKNQETEMEKFEWATIEQALQLDLFPPSRKGLEIAIEKGILRLHSDVPFNEVYANADGNGYFPGFSGCESCQVFNSYYSDNEGCSYSYNPDMIDWL